LSLFCLSGLLLLSLVYWWVRTLVVSGWARRGEEIAHEEALAERDETAFRKHMGKLADARRARELPPVKAKPTAQPPPSALKAPAAATSASAPTKDKIEITLKQSSDNTLAFLNVTNLGDDAIFWAILKTPAPVAGPSNQVVFARWEHTEDAKSLISHAETHQFRIGRLDNGSDSSFPFYTKLAGVTYLETWYIPYSLGGKTNEARAEYPAALRGGGFPPLVVTVTIYTDPPMLGGPIVVRVSLVSIYARLLS